MFGWKRKDPQPLARGSLGRRDMLAVSLSQSEYWPEAQASKHLSALGFGWHNFFAENGTHATLAQRDDTLYIVFRGTELASVADWLANLRFLKTPVSHGHVHRGFLRAMYEVWPAMRSEVVKRRPKKLVFTGHSQGAALATIAAFDLCTDSMMWPCDCFLITFGSPRVGDRQFVAALSECSLLIRRYVNNNDIVTRVPIPLPGWLQSVFAILPFFSKIVIEGFVRRLANWHHTGGLHYFSEAGDLYVDPPRGWQFRDRMQGRWMDLGEIGSDGLKDHFIRDYARLVEPYVHPS